MVTHTKEVSSTFFPYHWVALCRFEKHEREHPPELRISYQGLSSLKMSLLLWAAPCLLRANFKICNCKKHMKVSLDEVVLRGLPPEEGVLQRAERIVKCQTSFESGFLEDKIQTSKANVVT